MTKELPNELLQFKSAITGKLSNMSSNISKLDEKLSQICSYNKSTSSEISKNYKSSTSSNSAIAKFDTLELIVNNLKTDSRTLLNDAILKANSILININNLEELNKKITSLESNLSSEKNKTDQDTNRVNNLENELKSKNSEFDDLLSKTNDMLVKLKSIDKVSTNKKDDDTSASISDKQDDNKTSIDDYTKYLKDLKYGKLVRKKFVAKNGTKIDYLLYVPDYGREVTGLPINMYMHGSGMGQNDFSRLTRSGLGRFITDKKLKPSGIVILPLAPSGSAYNSKSFRDALAELPLAVAKEYNANTKKISLSGHSYGAITAYKLVNEHPNEFSAIVPVSGSNKVTSAFKNVNVWAFHGTADNKTKNTSYSQAVSAVKSIIQLGSKAVMHPYKGAGHGGNVVIDTFTKEYEMDGETINPLEWAFKQTRA